MRRRASHCIQLLSQRFFCYALLLGPTIVNDSLVTPRLHALTSTLHSFLHWPLVEKSTSSIYSSSPSFIPTHHGWYQVQDVRPHALCEETQGHGGGFGKLVRMLNVKDSVIANMGRGSTISKLVAENTAAYPDLFEKDVQMWVYEEQIELKKDSKHYKEGSSLSTGLQKLTHIINQVHENVKYLPGIALPTNVVANPSLQDAVRDSTILIFNLPHQFIVGLCKQMEGHIRPYARGISCIKGVNVQTSTISLFSETIGHELGIYCGALSGANIANEVAQEKFSETTIAYDPPPMDSRNPTPATSRGPSPSASHADLTQLEHKDVHGKPLKAKLTPLPSEYRPVDHQLMKKLFHRPYFHVRVVSDVAGVSLGGALKNVIAVAAGWVEGLGYGDNAKAAIMRVGLMEMIEFGKRFFGQTVKAATFTEESAGVADLIVTASSGRHVRCARMSIQEGKPIEEIEARELNGQKLQGTSTAYELNTFLKSQGMEKDFPLLTAVYTILEGNAKAEDIPSLIAKDDE